MVSQSKTQTPRWFRLVSGVFAGILVLTSCGLAEDESDQRRFANEPVDPVSTPVPTEAPPTEVPPTEAPLASPETLLDSRGAPSTVYVQRDGELLAVSVDAEADDARVITPDASMSLLAVDDAPRGDQVAVLAAGTGTGASLFIVDLTGEVILEREDVLDAADAGTPVPADGEVDYHVAWAAQGEQVLVSSSSGQLVNVPFEGDPQAWQLDRTLSSVMWAAWSPAGDQVAVLARDDDGRGRLYRVTPEGDTASVSEIGSALSANSVSSLESAAWIPDGTGLVMIEARRDDETPRSGTLYELNMQSGERTLVSTPGAGGPAASITSFSIAPNGRAVAFVIAIPIEDSWTFNGLWIQSLRDERRYSVPVAGDVRDVTRIWWTSGGIAWDQAAGAGDDRSRVLASKLLEDEGVVELLSFDVDEPEATPVASPAATPRAAPEVTAIGSPQATPDVSPVATPLGSPEATPEG